MIDVLTISYIMGEQLMATEDTEVDPEKAYITKGYRTVIPNDYDSPLDRGWYELVDGAYILSSDVEPDVEKEYYEYAMIDVEPEVGDNPSELGWIEIGEGETISSLDHSASLVVKQVEETIEIPVDEDDEEIDDGE